MDAKQSKIIVRDNDGNLIQILPEVKVSNVIDSSSSLPVTSSAVASYGQQILSKIVKEVQYSSVEPTTASTADLDNGSFIFWEQNSIQAEDSDALNPVYTIGSQTIDGAKTFTSIISGSIDGNAATATRASQDALGNDIASTYATKSEMPTEYAGATNSSNGTTGLVPAASIADKDKFLKGDGTWGEIAFVKEVLVSPSLLMQDDVDTLDNDSLVFQERTDVPRSDIPNRHLAFLKFNESAVKDEDGILEWNESGTCSLSNTEYKFNSSLELTGSNAIYAENCILGGKSFTIDFWVKVVDASSQWLTRIFSFKTNNNEYNIECSSGNFKPHLGNANGATVNEAAGDEWHHIEYVYVHEEELCELYVDGIKKTTLTGRMKRGVGMFVIGAANSYETTFARFFTGYIDCFQIIDGVAAHRDNFTPPTAESAIYVHSSSVNGEAKVEDIAKKGSLYAKDSSGSLIKIIPEGCIAGEDDTSFIVKGERTVVDTVVTKGNEELLVSCSPEVLQQISQFYSGNETGERFIYDGTYFGASSYNDRPAEYDADTNIKLQKFDTKWTIESEPIVRSISGSRSYTEAHDMPFGTHTIDVWENSNPLFVRIGYTLTSDRNITFTKFDIYKCIDASTRKAQLKLTSIKNEATNIDFSYVGATSSASGISGFVPGATPYEKNKFLKGDGTWGEISLPSDYIGATSSGDGIHGLVPAAVSADRNKFLRGDGTWATISSGTESSGIGNVDKVYAEVISASHTETENVHVLKNGWIGAKSPEEFHLSIAFGYSIGSSATSYATAPIPDHGDLAGRYMQTENVDDMPNTYNGRKTLKSNVKYSTTFTLESSDSGEETLPNDVSFAAVKISTGLDSLFTLEDGTIEHGSFFAAGSEMVAGTEYSCWSHNNDFIVFEMPTEGQTKRVVLNAFTRNNTTYTLIPNPDKFVDITYLGSQTYRIDFIWTYEEDRTAAETTTVKTLKTSVECTDGSIIETVKPIAGLLQNVQPSVDASFQYDSEKDAIVQNNAILLSKEDADGTKTVDRIDVQLGSIATYSASAANAVSGERINGFICGLDTSNLAYGGVCYEIESMEGSYSGI